MWGGGRPHPGNKGYCKCDPGAIIHKCGERGRAENVIRIVGEHAQHEAKIQFERRMEENANGNRFAKIRIKPTRRQKFKWRLSP